VSKKLSEQLSLNITIGARSSPLSKKQVEEVFAELKKHYPNIELRPLYVETTGDMDKKTSLRSLGKSDFFTKEIDQMLLKGECQAAIHSAKDLPEPLTPGLALAALTKGLDPSDTLVIRQEGTLPKHCVIATSSERREENVRRLYPDAQFVDIRGTIHERLEQLTQGQIDGVVIAEAALIRLELTHLNRVKLPGDTTPLQGRLAILIRKGDLELQQLFQVIDVPRL